MLRLVLAAALVLPFVAACEAQPAGSQSSPPDARARIVATPAAELPPLVFDDLHYAAADWTSQADRPVAERSVFGRAPWCTSLACSDTLVTRAWYHYLWRETGFANQDPLAAITADPVGGTLAFTVAPGEHPDAWPLQVASGFTARTGTWAARADFSAIPPEDRVRVMQTFWTLAPAKAAKAAGPGVYRGTEFGRVEVDFAFNNWFGAADSTGVAMGAGTFENSEQGVDAPLRGGPGAPPFSCRIQDGEGERLASPFECGPFLTQPGVWTTMVFRSDGRSMQFELRAEGPSGTLTAASDVIEGRAPSQRAMTIMSQTAHPPKGAERWSSTEPIGVVFDWVYYAAPPTRAFDAVLGDVAAIRAARVDGRRVERLRTAPLRLSRPYRPSPDPRTGLARYAPASVRIEGPQLLRPDQPAEYQARLDDLIGTHRIAWSQRAVDADGRAGAWSEPDGRPALRYTTALPAGAACLDLRIEVTEVLYTPREGGIDWVPARSDQAPALRARRRVCRSGTPADVRAGG